MKIKRIDHYSIRTTDVDASRKFYTEVIGLTIGPRPEFRFPGLWLCCWWRYSRRHPWCNS